MKNKTGNLGKSAVIFLVAAAFVKLIGALFKIPLSSSYGLGDLGFGYFSAAYDLFTPIYTLALSGFPVAIAKIISGDLIKGANSPEVTYLKVKRLLFRLSIPVILVVAALIVPLAYLSDNSGQGLLSYLAVLPSVFLCFAVSALRGYFEGKEQMTVPAISNVIEALGKLIFGLGFAIITVKLTGNGALGAAAAILGIALGTFVSLIYLKINYRKKAVSVTFKPENDKEFTRYFLSVSVPIAFAALAPSLVSFIDSLTVSPLLSLTKYDIFNYFTNNYPQIILDNTEELGNFSTLLYGLRSKAYTLYNLVPTLTTAIGVAAVPTISRLFAEGDKEGLNSKIALTVKFSAFLAVPAGVAFLLFGKQIMCLLFTIRVTSYYTGYLLSVYGVAAVFIGVAIPLSLILQSIGRQRVVLQNVLISLAVKLILNIVLTANSNINIFGSVFSTVAFAILLFIFNLVDLIKSVGFIKEIIVDSLKILSSTAACIITALILCIIDDSILMFIFAVFVAVIVYLFVNRLLNTFSKDEIKQFLSKN